MAVHLYGNVNGTYQKPNIDLFEMAKKQNNQPIRFCDTEAGRNVPAIKVNISEEGLRALHGSKMNGSVDIQKQMEENAVYFGTSACGEFYKQIIKGNAG